jgi:Zn-dependent protease
VDFTPDQLVRTLLVVVTLVLSVTVHEFSHAFAAHLLGDDFPERNGRLTLNPAAHVDPIGTLLLPTLFALTGYGAFGWGRPVEYIPTNITRKVSMRAGEAWIAFAGPLSNLILSILSAALLVSLLKLGVLGIGSPFVPLLQAMIQMNVVLFAFNLLPAPPLDGSKIVSWFFGQKADRFLDAIANAGTMGFLVVIIVGNVLINPIIGRMVHAIYAIFSI